MQPRPERERGRGTEAQDAANPKPPEKQEREDRIAGGSSPSAPSKAHQESSTHGCLHDAHTQANPTKTKSPHADRGEASRSGLFFLLSSMFRLPLRAISRCLPPCSVGRRPKPALLTLPAYRGHTPPFYGITARQKRENRHPRPRHHTPTAPSPPNAPYKFVCAGVSRKKQKRRRRSSIPQLRRGSFTLARCDRGGLPARDSKQTIFAAEKGPHGYGGYVTGHKTVISRYHRWSSLEPELELARTYI